MKRILSLLLLLLSVTCVLTACGDPILPEETDASTQTQDGSIHDTTASPGTEPDTTRDPVEPPVVAEPIPLTEGQTLYRSEETTLTVYQNEDTPMEVIFRWAIIKDENRLEWMDHYIYFDALSPEDGRIIGTMPYISFGEWDFGANQYASLLLTDTDIPSKAPVVTVIAYSNISSNYLNVSANTFAVGVDESGNVIFSGGGTAYGGTVISQNSSLDIYHSFKGSGRVLTGIKNSLTKHDKPGNVLISINPTNAADSPAVYSITEAPVVTMEHVSSWMIIRHEEAYELGIEGLYRTYGFCAKE